MMQFISKISDNNIPLSKNEQSILTDIEKHGGDEINTFAKKLSELKNSFWIKCTCNKNALLIICNLNGKIYIRCKSRKLHNISCIFIQKNIVLHLRNLPCASIKPTKQFALYRTGIGIINSVPDKAEAKSTNIPCSRLGQILFTVLHDARINVINANSFPNIIEQLIIITKSFQNKKNLITKDIELAKCYRYLLSEQSLIRAEAFLQKARHWFPQDLTPFIIFTSLATNISTNSFTAKRDNKTYKVQNKISTTSPWINLDKSAPYFIAVSTILNSNNEVILKDCFALPVFNSKTLVPIESNYERTILKILFSICKRYNNIIIEKPLFGFITKDKKKYRPDFILIFNNRKIFIEVLGSSNADYLTHKHYISQIAKSECYGYISVKAYELQSCYHSFVAELQGFLEQLNKKSHM